MNQFQIPRSIFATKHDITGLERCDDLFADPTSERAAWRVNMDNDALSAMDRNVMSMRFKDWKPVITNEVSKKVSSDKKYCYLYDGNPQVSEESSKYLKDPFLDGMQCSTTDMPRLGNPSFITNIFKDKGAELHSAGGLSYDKCIFEIDPTRMSSNNLNTFWSGLSKHECQSYSDKAQLYNQNLSALISACNVTLSNERYTLQVEKNNFKLLQFYSSNWIQCNSNFQILLDNLRNLRQERHRVIDCDWFRNSQCRGSNNVKGEKSILDEEESVVAYGMSSSNIEKVRKSLKLQAQKKEVGILENTITELKTQIKSYTQSYEYCTSNEVPYLEDLQLKVQKDIKGLEETITFYTTEKQRIEEALPAKKANQLILQNSIDNLNSQLRSKNSEYATCVAQLTRLQQQVKTEQYENLRITQLLKQCNIENPQFRDEYLRLLNRKNEYDNTNRQKSEQVNTMANTYRDVQTNEIKRSATELKEVTDAVCNSVDTITREISDLQQQMAESSTSTAYCHTNVDKVISCCCAELFTSSIDEPWSCEWNGSQFRLSGYGGGEAFENSTWVKLEKSGFTHVRFSIPGKTWSGLLKYRSHEFPKIKGKTHLNMFFDAIKPDSVLNSTDFGVKNRDDRQVNIPNQYKAYKCQ